MMRLKKGWQWSRGVIKMPEAKKAILSLHKMAKDLSDESDIAYARAVAHAISTIHVETHALGLVFYELSGIVRANINDNYVKELDIKIKYYYEKLQYWQEHQHSVNQTWAEFIVRDGKINKEKLLSRKNMSTK